MNELKKEIRTRYISKSIIFINIFWTVLTIFQIYIQFIPYLDNISIQIEGIPISFYLITSSFTLLIFSSQTMYSLRITNEKYLGVIENIVISPVSIFKYCVIRSIVCWIENFWIVLLFLFIYYKNTKTNPLFLLIFLFTITITWGVFFNLLNVAFRDVRPIYLFIETPSDFITGSIVPQSYLPIYVSFFGMIYPHRWLLEILVTVK